ncbi:MAG TPA: RNA polymerase sigma-70 factor [Bacteroidales bacterium]
MDKGIEQEFISKLQEGQEDAFESIFRKYFSGLCTYAVGYVKSKEVASEIVEDLFLYLWENCEDLVITTSLKAYLYQSVHNRCLKYLRHLKVEQKYNDHLHYTLTDAELHQPVSDSYPIANLISQELEELVESTIKSLPEKCREIFCLQRFDNLTYPEIAEKLDVSVNTVKTQMARALQKLRENLKEYLPMVVSGIVCMTNFLADK